MTQNPKEIPPTSKLTFGRTFTDHSQFPILPRFVCLFVDRLSLSSSAHDPVEF